jgi:hypothetical protein
MPFFMPMTMPVMRRMETYEGTTNGSGDYTVVYSIPFSVVPNVHPVIAPTADSNVRVRVSNSTVNGFTVRTEKSVGITVLGLDVLGLSASATPSVPVEVTVIAQ